MKKIIIVLLACLLMITNISSVDAQLDFQRLKQAILTGVNRAITRINNIENKIESNPRISDEAKQSIIEALDIVKEGLISYREEVEEAKTLKQLRAANQEIIKYLWENRNVLRENIEKAIIDMANETLREAEEFIGKVKQVLKILKIICPAERETISEVEAQLQQLENEIDILKQAIQLKDIPTIRQEIKKISQLSKDIRDNLEKIEEACLR